MTDIEVQARRSVPLDVARALAVIGVVFNHAVDGLVASGDLSRASAVGTVNDALYLFRIPALALLLGVFIPSGVAKRGTRDYLRRRITLVLYLYLVWHVLQTTVEVAASGVKNKATSPVHLVMPWVPDGQLWFLPFLAVATTIVALARPWAGPLRRVAVLLGLAVLTLFTWGWEPEVAGAVGLSVVLFTAVGASADLPWWSRRMQASLTAWLAVGAVAALCFVLLFRSRRLVPSTLEHPASDAVVVLSALAAGLGVIVLLAVAVALSRLPRAARALTTVGRRTLPVFLGHVVVVAGVRVVLGRGLGLQVPGVLLVTEVVLGVAVPLVLAVIAERTAWLRWLFELPRRKPPERTVDHEGHGGRNGDELSSAVAAEPARSVGGSAPPPP